MRMPLRKGKIILIVLSSQALAKLQISWLNCYLLSPIQSRRLVTALVTNASIFLLHQDFCEQCKH